MRETNSIWYCDRCGDSSGEGEADRRPPTWARSSTTDSKETTHGVLCANCHQSLLNWWSALR